MKKRLAISVAFVAVLIAAVSAKSITGSVTLATPNPTFMQDVSFTWSCDGCAPIANKSGPRIIVHCFQGNVEVFTRAGLPDDAFFLGDHPWENPNPLWRGGDAACSAELGYWTWQGNVALNWNVIALMSFTAAG